MAFSRLGRGSQPPVLTAFRGSALLITVALLATLTLTSGAPAVAQKTYNINFVNPSANGHSIVVSDKSSGIYHLAAWLTAVPENPRVEFFYEVSEVKRSVRRPMPLRTVGVPLQGIPVGLEGEPGSIMFEADWQIPDDLPEYDGRTSAVSLTAVLYDGDTEVARDTELVQINNASRNSNHPDDTKDRAETVALTDPQNGFRMPFAVGGDERPRGSLHVAISSGATSVGAHYSVTPWGEEPIWDDCGLGEDLGAGKGVVKCALSRGDEIQEVTAVGVVANGTDLGSGDVAVVIPMRNIPTRVTANKNRKFIRGRAQSSETECEGGREVSLFHRLKGPDDLVGSDSTDSLGRWEIKIGHGRGTFYVQVGSLQTTDSEGERLLNCQKARSKNMLLAAAG